MNSRRGGGNPSVAGPNNSQSKGKGPGPQLGYSSGSSAANGTNIGVDHLSRGLANNTSLDSKQDGDWEVFSKKTKNRGNAQQWPLQNPTPNAWARPNVVQKLGLGGTTGNGKPTGGAWQAQVTDPRRTNAGPANPQPYNRSLENNAPRPAIAPPLQNGWQWGARTGAHVTPNQGSAGPYDSVLDAGDQQHHSDVEDDSDDNDDLLGEDLDDDLMSDDFDSDCSVKSHGTRKKHPWFKHFFEVLDKLTVDQINEPSRQWHCPACRNGPGAIDWYRGLQPLMAHAKTKGAKRVKIHRELAEVLDEELMRRGTSVIPAGEAFGKWIGLRENVSDKDIVWPPMVVVMNTQLEMDENDEKWIGMGNQELLDYFSAYTKAVKARHSYGPKGHRGMSILIFESTAVGYLEAEHLDKHFNEQSTGRYAWEHNKILFKAGGQRQLYGYMAHKDDMEIFNKHCQGKAKLKFDVRSYQEMVVIPMKQMSEDNQQLVWLKNKVVKEQRHAKVLEESFSIVTRRYRKALEENQIVRERTKVQHEQNKEEMDYQEKFFKDQISIMHQNLEDKEKAFEEKLLEERTKVKLSTMGLPTAEDDSLRQKEMAEFIQIQSKGINEFEAEREELIKKHEDENAELTKKYHEDKLKLEKRFTDDLTKLMEKYAPTSSSGEVSTSATNP